MGAAFILPFPPQQGVANITGTSLAHQPDGAAISHRGIFNGPIYNFKEKLFSMNRCISCRHL